MSFRRGSMNVDFQPDWPNIDLGTLPNPRMTTRMAALARAVPRLFAGLRQLRSADIVIARNFDLLVLAWLGRVLSGARPRLVYECLDIHSLFTGTATVNAIMRFLERALLRRIDLLWVSSPGFVGHYFEAVQGYAGQHVVIENKLVFDGPPPPRPQVADRRRPGRPFRLGWVGSIRCAPSLSILAETARRMGDDIEIAVHGNIHRHAVPEFDAVLAAHANIRHFGPYSYPTDLAQIYLGCDAVWSQDLWQRGANSDWLLPNRIYEASWFGCPSIAVAGTETGRRVEEAGLGVVIAEPTAEALADALHSLGPDDLSAISRHILALPDREFRLELPDVDAALRPVLPGFGGGKVASTA